MEVHLCVLSAGISILKTKRKEPRNRINAISLFRQIDKIFIDTSIIEMFVDKTECITSLFIAKQGIEQELSLFVKGGNINLNSLDAWEMKPINIGQ